MLNCMQNKIGKLTGVEALKIPGEDPPNGEELCQRWKGFSLRQDRIFAIAEEHCRSRDKSADTDTVRGRTRYSHLPADQKWAVMLQKRSLQKGRTVPTQSLQNCALLSCYFRAKKIRNDLAAEVKLKVW